VSGFAKDKSIERVHLQYCKKLLGVKKTTQNDFIYGELGRLDFKTIHCYNILKFWTKIIHTADRKYISLVYKMLKTDCENAQNKINWCSLVKELLGTLGFYDVWLQQGVGNTNIFLSLVKQRLRDQFMQNWHGRLENSSRALFYLNISNFKFQTYLDSFTNEKMCKSLSRLRVSSHRLQIEAGRWSRPVPMPINERLCSVCNILEDEFHFVLECRIYNDIRSKYIPAKYWRRPSMSKFIELLEIQNHEIIRNLGTYIWNAFKKRSEIMYGNV
jgi:hypothetical protein